MAYTGKGKTGKIVTRVASTQELELSKKLSIARGQLSWYYSMLMWALNRIDSTPAVLLSLIKDRANAMRKEFPHNE